MTWYNKLQYLTLLLTVAGVGIDWRLGLWMAVSFGGASIISLVGQLVVQHRVGNRSLCPQLRLGLVAIVAYWLMLVVSLIYSNDVATALKVLTIKSSILIFPLAFLLTDTGWMTQRHLRGVGYALVLSLLGMFIYNSGVAIGKIVDGTTFESIVRRELFDARHHAYVALYLDVALLYIYFELYSFWGKLPGWWRFLLVAAVPIFILYVEIVNSRAGVIVMYVVLLFSVLHFMLTRRRWLFSVLLMLSLAGYTTAVEHFLPGHKNRVVETLHNVDGDVRMDIYKDNIEATMSSPVVGYGTGDYNQEQKEKYKENGHNFSKLNAHNQYLESTMSMGFIGLGLLLLWLLWPMGATFLWMRRGKVGSNCFWIVSTLTFCVMSNLMFESMLERQMGLLFVSPLWCFMLLTINIEKNKFGQFLKK